MAARHWDVERGASVVKSDPALVDFVLPETEIHIWQASLDVSSIELQWFTQMLSVEEQARAQRFHFLHHRHRYIASHGILRTLLGRYLQISPVALQFCYSNNGKPALTGTTSALVFNISHSENLLLCAIAHHCCLGVDLEFIRPLTDLEQLTQRFFSAQEHAAIQSLSGEQQLRSFFQHWTCKEALVKAIGAQLMNLSQIEVCITNDVASLIRWGTQTAEPLHQWSLQLFMPTPNYMAAVAVDAPERSLIFQHWQSDYV